MQASDLPELEKRLSELADAFGGRAPTKGALKVWLDALRECQMDEVKAALSDWPKSHMKAPTPAEILKICRERVSVRIEETSRKYNAEPGFDVSRLTPPDSPMAKEAFKEMKRILNTPRDPKAWAYRLKAREEAGEHLDVQQSRLWRGVIGE